MPTDYYETELRDYLAKHLPEYMIPSEFAVLPAFSDDRQRQKSTAWLCPGKQLCAERKREITNRCKGH